MQGFSKSESLLKAGFSPSYVKAFCKRIWEGEQMKQVLLDLGQAIQDGEIGTISKALLMNELLNLPKGAKNLKNRITAIRTGGEFDKIIGGGDLHLHEHRTLPPAVQKMLEDKMREILASKEEAIDGTIVSEGAASEGESRKDDEGVQGGELTYGFQDRAIG